MEEQPVLAQVKAPELPPVSLKKGAGGIPLDPGFLGGSQKKQIAHAFKEFDDL